MECSPGCTTCCPPVPVDPSWSSWVFSWVVRPLKRRHLGTSHLSKFLSRAMGLLGEIHGNSKPFQLRNGRKGWLINCSQANPSHQSKPLKTWMAMSMVEFGKFWKPLKMSRIATQKTDLMQSGAPESCTSDEPLPIHLQLGQVAK